VVPRDGHGSDEPRPPSASHECGGRTLCEPRGEMSGKERQQGCDFPNSGQWIHTARMNLALQVLRANLEGELYVSRAGR